MAKPAGLTVKQVEALQPRATAYEVKDDAEAGLYVTVLPSGARSFVWRYRFHNKSKKLTFGPVSLAEARKRARASRNLRDDGVDPAQQKQSERRARTAAARQAIQEAKTPHDDIESLVGTFVERHHKATNRSWREAERVLKREIIGPWRGRRLSEISRADIHSLLDAIVDRPAPIVANRVLAHLRKLCRWALARGVIAHNPCDGLTRPTRETPRDRVLDDRELVLVWKAADVIGWPFGALVKLLILTGQRRSEIAEGRWSEIDLTAGVWSLPADRVKNKRPHTVPLSAQAVDIIESLPRLGEFLLTTNGRSAISGFSRAKRALDAAITKLNGGEPLSAFAIHDLRRSVASGLQRQGVALSVIEKILNHTSGSFAGIVGVYQRNAFEPEKRAALDAWGRHIARLVEGQEAAKVTTAREHETV